ncbi:MAG TPA: DAK2 domain-containing protein [Acidimicrobiales bacterium]|nr:DAK2 domain-containing protein [Acidimicrobiales bacterium]
MEALGRLSAADVARVMSTYSMALREHQEVINRLNVYPVPDGDTGTNMALTLESVVEELGQVDGLDNGVQDAGSSTPDMGAVCKAVAHGSLMGARGNSGVILSQLLRGLAGVLARSAGPGGAELSEALEAASEAAYKAVLRPVEGTILTVARAAAEGAGSAGPDASLEAVLEAARSSAADALARTPEMLPVLAEAGVVDAGGSGYLLFVDSLLNVVDGRPLPDAPQVAPAAGLAGWPTTQERTGTKEGPSAAGGTTRGSDGAGSEVVPSGLSSHGGVSARAGLSAHGGLRYEVMYFLEAPDDTIPAFKEVWEGIGDSIVVVGGDGLWNCHIHTNDVGAAVEAALDAGRPRDIRVSDLAEQIEEERWVREGTAAPPLAPAPRLGPAPRTSVVAVATGEGVGRIFRSLGVHHLVPGGQSMNPSTSQILDVVDATPSDEVVILPNNDNIVPVAMQACELAKKTVRVVPTGGIVEGFAALLEYDPEAGVDENFASMSASARRVVAGEVTQAVRDATGPAGPIRAGDWMGMSRNGVEVVAETLAEAACGLLGKLLSDDHELVTLIEGEGVAGGDTRQVTEWLAEQRPSVAVEVHHGGQPLYPYLISIE